MKFKLLFAATIFAFTTTAQAIPPKPAKCPGTAAISSIGLQKETMEQDNDGWGGAVLSNAYDTAEKWTFVLMGIKAKDADDAYDKAMAGLKNLNYDQGPVQSDFLGRWLRTYTTESGYTGVAITPVFEDISNLHSISKSIRS